MGRWHKNCKVQAHRWVNDSNKMSRNRGLTLAAAAAAAAAARAIEPSNAAGAVAAAAAIRSSPEHRSIMSIEYKVKYADTSRYWHW